jgi:hypothetical protein
MGIFDRGSTSDRSTDQPVVSVRGGVIRDISAIAERVSRGGDVPASICDDMLATLTSTERGFRLAIDDRYADMDSLTDAGRRYVLRDDGRAEVEVYGRIPTPHRADLLHAGVREHAIERYDLKFRAIASVDVSTDLFVAAQEVAESFRDARGLSNYRAILRQGPDSNPPSGYMLFVNGRDLGDWAADRGARPVKDDVAFKEQYDWESVVPQMLVRAIKSRSLVELAERLDSVRQDVARRRR